jgi:hypothetical protein
MVVLLIGIFAIVRLFPGGFLTIARTGELSSASALAQEQLSDVSSQLSPPQSIVAANFDVNGNLVVDDTILPDDLRDLQANDPSLTNLSVKDPYFVSNINRIRYVLGETFRVPISNQYNGQELGGIYVLHNGPVFNVYGTTTGPSGTVPTDSISVYSTALQRLEQPAAVPAGQYDDTVVLQNADQYVIDYTNMLIGFLPRLPANPGSPGSRQFKISFDYYTVNPNNSSQVILHSVVDGPGTVFTVPDDTNAGAAAGRVMWVHLFNNPNDAVPNTNGLPLPTGLVGIRRNSDEVSHKFALVSTTAVITDSGTVTVPTWSTTDPYQYAWISQQEANNANAGVLVFNPIAHGATINSSTGPQPLTARVDYLIFDNHILREQRNIPGQAPYSIKLGVQFVLTNGDALADQSTYNGMFRSSSGPTPDLLVYNANTGIPLLNITNGQITTPLNGGPGTGTSLDPVTGILRLDQGFIESNNLRNASIKVLYMAQKEWGMQLQKANGQYVPADTLADITYKSYYVGGTDPNDTSGSPSRIYFPLSEAGKTVVIGDYYLTTTDKNGVVTTTHHSGEAFRINADSAQFQTLSSATGQLTWIQIPDPASGNVVATSTYKLDPTVTGKAVVGVSGGSLKARVVLRDASRWRTIDSDTFLNVAPAR